MIKDIILKIMDYINSQNDINLLRMTSIKKYYLTIDTANPCDIGKQSAFNNVFYSDNAHCFYLGKGLLIEFYSGHERLGNSVLTREGVNLSSILTENSITLFFRDCYNSGSNTDDIDVSFTEYSKILEYIITYSKSDVINKRDIVQYLNQPDSIVSIYKVLDQDLRNDNDIIKVVLKKIYDDSCSLYEDIHEYNDISPYGGEDITYFPKSPGHCFIDNLVSNASKAGIEMNPLELEKMAYHILVQENDIKILEQLLNEYESKKYKIDREDAVIEESNKYAISMDRDDLLIRKIDQIDIQIKNLDDKLKLLVDSYGKDILSIQNYEEIKDKLHNNIYKYLYKLLFNKQYKKLFSQLAAIEQYIYTNDLMTKLKLKRNKLKVKSESVYKNINFKLLLPGSYDQYEIDVEEINRIFHMYREFIKNNTEKYTYIKSILNQMTVKIKIV